MANNIPTNNKNQEFLYARNLRSAKTNGTGTFVDGFKSLAKEKTGQGTAEDKKNVDKAASELVKKIGGLPKGIDKIPGFEKASGKAFRQITENKGLMGKMPGMKGFKKFQKSPIMNGLSQKIQKGVSNSINGSNDRAAYNQKQKLDIQSGPKSMEVIGGKSKLESAGDQMAAKVALNAIKATPAGKIASMIPGANGLMEDAAGKAIEMVKEKAKKKIKMQIISWTAGCLMNPITWVVIMIFLLLMMLSGASQDRKNMTQGDKDLYNNSGMDPIVDEENTTSTAE